MVALLLYHFYKFVLVSAYMCFATLPSGCPLFLPLNRTGPWSVWSSSSVPFGPAPSRTSSYVNTALVHLCTCAIAQLCYVYVLLNRCVSKKYCKKLEARNTTPAYSSSTDIVIPPLVVDSVSVSLDAGADSLAGSSLPSSSSVAKALPCRNSSISLAAFWK